MLSAHASGVAEELSERFWECNELEDFWESPEGAACLYSTYTDGCKNIADLIVSFMQETVGTQRSFSYEELNDFPLDVLRPFMLYNRLCSEACLISETLTDSEEAMHNTQEELCIDASIASVYWEDFRGVDLSMWMLRVRNSGELVSVEDCCD